MKAYKLEIFVIDFDNVGKEGILQEIENARFPNDCIGMNIKSVIEKDIGEWNDDHPLNKKETAEVEYNKLFNPAHEWDDSGPYEPDEGYADYLIN